MPIRRARSATADPAPPARSPAPGRPLAPGRRRRGGQVPVDGLTVREMLGQDAMRGTRIIAGADGLDRVVRRLNVMTVPNIVRWTKQDEFLLTTGYPLPREPGEFCQLIEQLAANGLAGLGRQAGRVPGRSPGRRGGTGRPGRIPDRRDPAHLAAGRRAQPDVRDDRQPAGGRAGPPAADPRRILARRADRGRPGPTVRRAGRDPARRRRSRSAIRPATRWPPPRSPAPWGRRSGLSTGPTAAVG